MIGGLRAPPTALPEETLGPHQSHPGECLVAFVAEETGILLRGTGEGSFNMSEQLALD